MREPNTPKSPSFSALVQSFFTEYLVTAKFPRFGPTRFPRLRTT